MTVNPVALAALREHIESVELEGQVAGWSPEQRRLVFPNRQGNVQHYPSFLRLVWKPLLAAAGLAYRKPHSTRHTFATGLMQASKDVWWVQQQLGHASIEETVGTYGHMRKDARDTSINALDQYLQ